MSFSIRLLVLITTFLHLSSMFAVAQTATARVRSSKVFLGEPFVFSVVIEDAEEAKIGEFNPEGFNVVRRGAPSTSTQMTIINGRRSDSVTTTYQYLLSPLKAGKFTVKPPVVNYLGELLPVDAIDIEVVGPEESDLFEIIARVDRPSVYPLQRFEVELEINLKELDKPFRVLSPVSSKALGGAMPELQIPWLDDESLPKGVTSEEFDFQSIMSPNRSGFGINDLSSRSFFESRKIPFLPEEEKFKRPGEKEGEESGWFRYRIKRSFTPTKPGKYLLGRASLRGRLISKIVGTQGTFESVFGVTEPVEIEVKPLPLDDRPDSWCGVIGELDVASHIAPTDARVGEPLTLTLSLTGTGLLSDAFPPELTSKEITDRFRVYEATSKPSDSGRDFTYSLRAKEPGDIQFPAIELTWFDPNRERYVTGKTSPIPLSITKATALSGDSILAAPATKQTDLSATTGGLAANMTSIRIVDVQPTRWFGAWCGIAVLTAISWFFVGRGESAEQVARAKKKRRLDAADLKLREGLTSLAANETANAISSIREAVNLAANAVTASDDTGLTTEEATSRLRSVGIDEEIVSSCRELLEQLDAARYGGLSGSAEEMQQQAKSTISDVIKAARGVKQ